MKKIKALLKIVVIITITVTFMVPGSTPFTNSMRSGLIAQECNVGENYEKPAYDSYDTSTGFPLNTPDKTKGDDLTTFLPSYEHRSVNLNRLNSKLEDNIPEFVPGCILLKFIPGVDVSTPNKALMVVQQITSSDPSFAPVLSAKPVFSGLNTNSEKKRKYGLDQWLKVTFENGLNLLEELKRWENHPFVSDAQLNYRMELFLEPNDPYYYSSGSWGQDYPDLWGLHRISASGAWDFTTGSDDVVVAVVDTGVDYDHEDIHANMWINEDEIPGNGIDDDNDNFTDNIYGADFYYNDGNPMDGHGHGTHCSGTIAAVGNNSLGVVGVNWRTSIMAVKGLSDGGSGWSDVLADAIRWAADNGADVISNSWGPYGGNPSDPILEDACRYVHDLDFIIVFAAGNDNADVINYSPANMDETIAVVATDYNDQKAGFSNWGELIDVSAPGVDILSLRANGTDMYLGTPGYEPGANFVPPFDPDAEYYRSSGTSMACPHVAGLCALILSHHPEFTNEEVRQVLRASCDDVEDPGWDIKTAYGRINASRALQIDSVIITNICFPELHSGIWGYIDIVGTASGPDFHSYRLEYGRGVEPTSWSLIAESFNPVVNGILVENWDTNQTEDGIIAIRLTSTDTHGQEFQDRISVSVNQFFGDIVEEGWPVEIESYPFRLGFGSSPTLGDLDEDGDMEIVIGSSTGDVYVFHHNGTLIPGWPVNMGSMGISATPALGDLDNDGDLEIVIASLVGKIYAWHHTDFNGDGIADIVDGFPYVTGDGFYATYASPAIGDINYDGYLEIVIGTEEGKLYAVDHQGDLLEGWPVDTYQQIYSTAALYDIDDDGDLEIFTTTLESVWIGGDIVALHHDGTPVENWDPYTTLRAFTSPAIGDIDSDGDVEIIYGSDGTLIPGQGWVEGAVFALHHNGSLVDGWPVYSPLENVVRISPALADLDGNGDLEIIIKCGDGYLYAFHNDGSSVDGWPQSVDSEYFTAYPIMARTTYGLSSSPVVGDLDGDDRPEIAIINITGHLCIFNHDGSLVENFPTLPSIFFKYAQRSTPAMADIDLDGDIELVMDDYSDLYVLDIPGDHFVKNLDWPMFHNDLQNAGCYLRSIMNFDTGECFDTIQEAIDDLDTTAGHTIFVPYGIYHEHVVINKSISLMGEGRYFTIIEGNGSAKSIVVHVQNIDFVNITGLTLRNASYGVYVESCSNTTVMNNIIVDNYLGLMIDSEGNFNCIYHNTFNNTENAFDAGSENLWDKDYYDGFRPFGGNLWSDYNGNDEFSGPDQNIPGSDGIGDTVYDIDGRDSQDRYPLMKPWTGPLPATIYVDDNNTDPPWIGTPEHPYQYIQDAVEITMNGDRVFVFNGTYYENVVVHKSINLIGEDKNTVIIDGGGNGDVVHVRAGRVNISGFTIQNSGSSWRDNGISVINPNNKALGNISGNIITNNSYGIYLSSSYKYIISGNTIVYNNYRGIHVHYSSEVTITGNNIIDNTNYGIYLSYRCENNIITRNSINKNKDGVYLNRYSNNNNVIYENTLNDNDCGINVSSSSSNNIIYHNNFINNIQQAYDEGSNNWDDGYPSGGNYWSDHICTGNPSDGSDPYNIPPYSAQDRYPFQDPDGWLFNQPPYPPSDPSPEDGATDISVDVVLSWTGGDPDSGDTVTYDVYFGTTSPPPKVVDNQSETTYNPGELAHETTYYWRIVAWDNHQAHSDGPIWEFTTGQEDTESPAVTISKPEDALYIRNKKKLPLRRPLIIGFIDIEVKASDEQSGIEKTEFYIDDQLKATDTLEPYSWMWNERTPFRFRHTIKVIAYDTAGNSASDEIKVWKFL